MADTRPYPSDEEIRKPPLLVPNHSPNACPMCGSSLRLELLHIGGRGYVRHDLCSNPRCDFLRKAKD
jgi:hypothetical protein